MNEQQTEPCMFIFVLFTILNNHIDYVTMMFVDRI